MIRFSLRYFVCLMAGMVMSAGSVGAQVPEASAGSGDSTGDSLAVGSYPSFLQAQKVAILSSEVAGKVLEVKARPQDFVSASEVLLQIDPKMIRLNLKATQIKLAISELNIKEADVRYEYARDNLQIVETLYNNQVGGIPVSSQKELKESRQAKSLAELAQAKARANRESLMLEKEQAQALLEKHAIRAPFAGVVVPFSSVALKYLQGRAQPKRVEVGETVAVGQLVTAVMKVDRLRVSHWLPAAQLNRVHLGQKARVYVEGFSEPFAAKVVYISPTISPTGQFNIEVELANPPIKPAGAAKSATVTKSVSTSKSATSSKPAVSAKPIACLGRDIYRYKLRDGMRARVELPAQAQDEN